MTAVLDRESTSPASAERGGPTWVRPWRLFALLGGLLFLASAIHPFRDVDVYWHLRLGREIVEGRSVSGAGEGWSFGLPEASWTTTQWLSEVLLHAIHRVGGFEGIAVMQFVSALGLALGLAALLLRGTSTRWAPAAYVVLLVPVAGTLQERPALLSMLLLLWLAPAAYALLERRPGPRAPAVLLVTVLWANLHGLWVLVPAVLGLLVLGRLLEKDVTGARRPAVLLGISLLAGCLTPVGPALLLSPFRFSAAAEHVNEWQPTSVDSPFAIALALLVAGLVLSWARGGVRVPRSEIVYFAGLVGFSLLALRNVPPAAVLLAPLVVARLEGAFPREDAVSGPRERRALAAVCAVLVVAAVPALVAQALRTPTLPDTVPVALAQRLAEEPGEPRVLADYNTSGAVLLWGGPRTTVYVDGRADRYGADFVEDYLALVALRGDWRADLGRTGADWALLPDDAPLRGELPRLGWTQVASDDHHVLLRAP